MNTNTTHQTTPQLGTVPVNPFLRNLPAEARPATVDAPRPEAARVVKAANDDLPVLEASPKTAPVSVPTQEQLDPAPTVPPATFHRPNTVRARFAPKLFITGGFSHPKELVLGKDVEVSMTVVLDVEDLTQEERDILVDTATFTSARFKVDGVPMIKTGEGSYDGRATFTLSTPVPFRLVLSRLDLEYVAIDRERRVAHLAGLSGAVSYENIFGTPVVLPLSKSRYAPNGSLPLGDYFASLTN